MKSNYRKLGKFIELVSNLNTDLNYGESDVRGVSNNKEIMQTKADNRSRDLSGFYVVAPDDFIYNSRTSRMGDKVGLGFNDTGKAFITSFNNTVFKVKNEELLPMYLFMWFSRPEFDRYVRYHSWGSSTEIFPWKEMCNVELPIPHIDKQKEIVAEYNTIVNRIKLNEQLNQKLEETAHAIYKQWFVDFEFPDENGNPYKSSGGEMVRDEILDKEIPKGWCIKTVGDVSKCNVSTLTTKDKFKTIEYLDTSNITNNEIHTVQTLNLNEDIIPSRAKRKVNHNDIVFSTVRPNLKHFGILENPKQNMIVSTGFAVLKPTYPNVCGELIYLLITNVENLQSLQARAEMSVSTYPSINPEDLLNIYFLLPKDEILLKSARIFKSQFEFADFRKKEKNSLRQMKTLLLEKMTKVK